MTKKEFDKLCKIQEPLYVADEWDARGRHWSVWKFRGVKGEYKQLEVKEG